MNQAMGPMVWLSIAAGAVLGAWSRWLLGLLLNRSGHLMPWGTLLVNVVGGLVIGMALAVFERRPDMAAAWRPFLVTGFLGCTKPRKGTTARIENPLCELNISKNCLEQIIEVMGNSAGKGPY